MKGRKALLRSFAIYGIAFWFMPRPVVWTMEDSLLRIPCGSFMFLAGWLLGKSERR